MAGSLELAWQFAEVDKRARTDPLTGLWNRQHFGEQLQQVLSGADRRGSPVSLVLVDIDHFKRVNDTWGHRGGRRGAQAGRAACSRTSVREVDICVRYGGEEIALLLPQTGQPERGRGRRATAERSSARSRSATAAADIPVTASFGVATYPETVKVRDQLFPAADKALYIAKHEGRNRVRAKPAIERPHGELNHSPSCET